jgi:FADH2 O2-dependent halogenase
MRPHRLAGGGFAPFFAIQAEIDALIDAVDPEDEAEVERTVAAIRGQFDRFPWTPSAIRDLLDGKNHLPDNKLRLNLLHRQRGLLGDGDYRKHFFGDVSRLDLLRGVLADLLRYSAPALKLRRRTQARLAQQARGE